MTTDTAFRARLEPERSAADLDQRARKGLEICLAAIAEGNQDRATRAFARMVSRWVERDALMAAPVWLWEQRWQAVCSVIDVYPEGWPGLHNAVYEQFYYTLGHCDGMTADQASDYAYGRNQNRKALEAPR